MEKKKIKKTKTGKLISYRLTDKQREKSMERLIKLAHEIDSRKRQSSS